MALKKWKLINTEIVWINLRREKVSGYLSIKAAISPSDSQHLTLGLALVLG